MQTPPSLARSPAAVLLLLLTVLRLVVAGSAPLSPDEAYYWVWSRALAPGYLDHPPMVALWVWLGTAVAGDTPLGIRLLAPLSAAWGSVLLAGAGDRLFPGRGVYAAALLNGTLMLAAGAVTMTPDTPLLFFWTAAIYALARLATGGAPAWFLIVGAASGLALDSKYTAALLGLGIALWLLTPRMRPALATPWPWLGGAVAALLVAPVVLWNAAHGWASLLKQGGRATDWAPARAGRYLLELLGGQAGLATPLVFVLFVAGTAAALRRWRDPAGALIAALVVPGSLLFLEHAVGDRVQANWVAILYPGAALAAAGLGARWAIRLARPGLVLGFSLAALLYLQASLAPLPLPRGLDPTLRLAGFDRLAAEAADKAQRAGLPYLASEEYGLAGLLALESGLPVLAAEPRWRLFDLDATPESRAGLLLLSARRAGPDPALWQSSAPVGALVRARSGTPVEAYSLWIVTPRPGAPAVRLPRPVN